MLEKRTNKITLVRITGHHGVACVEKAISVLTMWPEVLFAGQVAPSSVDLMACEHILKWCSSFLHY